MDMDAPLKSPKHGAKKIAASVRALGHTAAELHANRSLSQRREALDGFKNGKYRILVATDIAARGIDVKGIELVINYDLPWNPNRIEQRFGRVHRIGQREVCHMWSLVAKDTREGDVYSRLLQKLEQQRSSLGGRIYDVLGQVFDGNSLRDLMISAIRYGDSPESQARLFEIVDAHVRAEGQGLVSGRHFVHIEALTAGGVMAVEHRAVPGGNAVERFGRDSRVSRFRRREAGLGR